MSAGKFMIHYFYACMNVYDGNGEYEKSFHGNGVTLMVFDASCVKVTTIVLITIQQ